MPGFTGNKGLEVYRESVNISVNNLWSDLSFGEASRRIERLTVTHGPRVSGNVERWAIYDNNGDVVSIVETAPSDLGSSQNFARVLVDGSATKYYILAITDVVRAQRDFTQKGKG